MKEIQYIAPALKVTPLYLRDGILQSASAINGSGSNNFDDARDGGDGEEADVKRGFNIWSDDWSR